MFLTALGIILIIIAVCLWLLCPIRISQLKRRTAEAEGYAAEPELGHSRIRGIEWTVDYSYIVNSIPQTLKAFKLHVPSADKVTICYNPINPRDGHVKEFRTLNPQVFVTIGGIFAYVGVVLAVVGTI